MLRAVSPAKSGGLNRPAPSSTPSSPQGSHAEVERSAPYGTFMSLAELRLPVNSGLVRCILAWIGNLAFRGSHPVCRPNTMVGLGGAALDDDVPGQGWTTCCETPLLGWTALQVGRQALPCSQRRYRTTVGRSPKNTRAGCQERFTFTRDREPDRVPASPHLAGHVPTHALGQARQQQ